MKQRKSIYQGQIVNLGLETVKLPNDEIMELEVVRHPGGAAVVAIDEKLRICLLRQYRYAAGDWLWELPAGKIDPGESPEQTVRRELQEEAGLAAADWKPLGSFLSTPGFCDERIHLFMARGLQQVATTPHPHEVIEIHWLHYQLAVQKVHSGEIDDAKTMLGILLARTTQPDNE